MPRKIFSLSWFLLFLCLWVPSFAVAGSLVFNDSLAGPIEVYSLDWVPGNSLADEALPLSTDPNNPTRFNQAYQAALGNFLNGSGNVITGTGLNTAYEITIVSSYGQIGVRSPLDIDNDGFVEIENSNFDLDAAAHVNLVEIYLDTNRNANSLSGTGYRDGILLMKGIVSTATGQFSASLDLDGNNILDLKVLDQFLTNNYPGTGTISGTGSAQLTVQIDPASVNPAYFPGVGSAPLTFFFNTSLILPYYQQNPSASVVGVVPELGPASGGYSRVNGLASLDPAEQIDMLFQADANSSISVGPCIDIIKEVSVDGGLNWFDANTLDESPGTTDGAIYRFIVTNCSSVTLTDVTVSDPNLGEDGLPLIVNLGTLAPDDSVTVEPNSPLLEKPLLCADVPPPGNEDPVKFNLAKVVGTVIGTSATVEDTDPAYVRCLCVDIEKRVSVDGGATFVDADQCVDPAAPIAAGAVEYQLVVSNCGAAVLDDVRVVDSLLGIDELVGTLWPEQVVTYDKETLPALLQPDFCALFGSDTEGSRDIDNTATVTATALNQQFDLSDADSACVSCLCSGSIGDFVWNDLNRDGIQNEGEPGIAGVTVSLLMGGQTLGTATTDAFGFYEFTGLCAGDYVVDVDETTLPMGYVPSPNMQGGDPANDSNGSPANVTLPTDNSTDPTIDFGFYIPCSGSIGDFVWNDLNRDGIQDVGEPGISAVTVNLLQGGAVIATTMTDGNGFYQFSDLCAGTYAVTVATPDGYTVSPSLQGGDMAVDSNGSPATVTLTTDNSSDPTVDFGFYLMDAQIGDFVWLDENRNGIQDAGEAGLPGVTVNLLDCDDNLIETTSTDSTGYYSFTVEPGDYKVQFMLPGGYAFSPQDQGGDDALDGDAGADGMTICTTLAPGETDLTWDAGMYPMPASIGDYVWNDTNKNGVQDAGEMGIAGVTVTLIDCTTDELVATTTTDANGKYLFENLMPGSYRVEFAAPMGYAFTMQNVGDDALDSDANASGVTDCYTLVAGESNTTVDAGLYLMPASIGDYVWNDTNKNGVQDAGEMGIAGVTVTLIDCTTDELVATTTTDANGKYLFENLMPGSYRVEFTAPMGYAFTLPNQGGDDAKDSDANASGVTDCVTLAAGESNTTVDAGLYLMPASIGDYVWNDTNKNGVQDAGEMGIAGVTVTLIDCTTDELVATTTTDANGKYLFENLMPGSYRVEFTAPMGYAFTMPNQGADDALDSDANASGVTDCLTLVAGENNTTVDAGLYALAPAIDIEKFTNGEDADMPTGPMVVIGSPINWTYVVTNTGDVTLANVLVVDDKGVAVTCPAATLVVGESMTCTANGTALEGQYANIGTATGNYGGMSVTDSDPSHYYGVKPEIHLTKDVSVDGGMTWFEADNITQCSDPNVPNVEVCNDYSDCGTCEGKVTSLTLAYRGTSSAKIKITNRDGFVLFSQDVVNPGQQLTFLLADGSAKLTTEIKIYVNGSLNTAIHTSCSQPIGPGLISGSFEVVAGKSLYGGNLCPVNHDGFTAGCGECEGKVNSLTLAYRGASTAYIKITNRDGQELFRQDKVSPNQQFSFATANKDGRLTTEIKIYVNGSLNTTIHTSCSVPIGPGLVKGSFEVIAGTSLYGGKLCPINGTIPDPGSCTPDEVMYRFTVTNVGGVTLSNLTLTDSLYDLSAIAPDCMLPETLAPGQSYTCTSISLPTQMGLITNTATATGDYAGITVTDSNDASYCGPYQPVPAIDIEKYTNGEDADTPTGPMVAVGSPITWTYVVTNTGNVTLNDVTVVDNKGVAVSCPSSSLLAGEVMTCTGNGTAMAGQYANLGTAKGFYNGMLVTDSDPSHYYATPPAIDVEKFVSTDGVNWFDADTPPGIEVAVCPELSCDAGSEYDCQTQKDFYWKEYERTKYDHDSKKSDYDKKKSDRDRSKSDHDKSRYTRDSSKKDCDGKQKEYESAKAKYEFSKSYSDRKMMSKAKAEYDYAKSECDRKDSDYSSKKSDHDRKKEDCDRSKSDYDKAKTNHSKAKSDWEKHKDRDCSQPSDPNCGTSDCQSPVYFKFVVTNTGTMMLADLTLEDSDYGTDSCVIPATLAPGASYDCVIGPQEAAAGQHTNTATATGTYMGAQVSDTDDANYFGKAACTAKGTGTPGYWMNHPAAWPVESIVIGGVTYSKTKAIELIKAPTKTDKTYTMFQALAAAKLNVLTCNESSCIDAAILAADNWLKTYGPVGRGVSGSSSAWALGEPLYHLLDEYNNGLLCAPSRDTMDRDDEKDKRGTSTQSHWKNKDKSWPTSSLSLGGKSYSKDEATSRMSRASNKDVTYTMYRALAAAKLNVRKGNDSSCISDTIKYVDEWLERNPLGRGLTTGSSTWRSAEPYFQRLDEYNNGKLCSSYCDSATNTSTWSSWSR